MTNHPDRGTYQHLIAKLQRISVDATVAPDARRLAVDAYQAMIVAQEYPRCLQSDASYRNLHGDGAAVRMLDDEAALDAERATNMEHARNAAGRFLAAWDLC